ncbi:TetR family transcriptional regulator [Dactylosporangium cerinum]|uniref:TetR family transcriptional regulator n=1 Tax=Dactylosporangium cerinum TaxID=1434730 RepID=A0ABV9WI73_9ACTN
MTDTAAAPRRRDAAATRLLLLDAARRRFAADGYSATTVRDIAEDAGVNVALIHRYFTSKEGLFEACLTGVSDELGRTVGEDLTLDRIAHDIAARLVGPHTAKHPNQILLLLRSSGDERAERIRQDILGTFAVRLAMAGGWRADLPDADQRLLSAQITLATAFGLAVLRSSTTLEPLASAGHDDLVAPLTKLVNALLKP